MKQNHNNIYTGWRNICRYLIRSKLSWCSSGPKFNTKISHSKQDKKAAYHLYQIRQIAKFLDLPAKKTLISSLVMSQLDYATAIFINLPNNSIHPMQRIQNQADKLIMNRDRCESSTSTMRQLHWLPIGFRCKCKVLLLVYRCMNGQAPEYLQQKLSLKNPAQITRSATEGDILQIPYNKRRTLADHGFSSAGPRLWNSLPVEL